MHETKYQSPFAASAGYANLLMLTAEDARRAIGVLSQTISAEPEAYWTRCFRAGCYVVLREFDLAKHDLDEVEKASSQLSWVYFYRTLLYYAEGNTKQLDSLNELLALYPGCEANMRQLLGTNLASDPRIKWPKQPTSPNKSD